ncbi:glycoside hydrolase family 2 TIM barrel-domain containing protein, partial [Candidatus Hydrogenedentota bacterium]
MPPPPEFWDICDEKGILCIEEMYYDGVNPLNRMDVTFEANVDKMVTDIVMRDRNHPSIVNWSIENEVFYHDQSPTTPEVTAVARVRGVIEAIDATRLVGCDHEGTLDGRLAIKNKHYPGSISNLNDNLHRKTGMSWYPIKSGLDIYFATAMDPMTVPNGVGEYHWIKSELLSGNWSNMYHPTNWGLYRAYVLRGWRYAGFSDIRTFTLGHDSLRIYMDAGGTRWSTRNCHMMNRKSMAAVAVFDHDYDARDVRQPLPAVN